MSWVALEVEVEEGFAAGNKRLRGVVGRRWNELVGGAARGGAKNISKTGRDKWTELVRRPRHTFLGFFLRQYLD